MIYHGKRNLSVTLSCDKKRPTDMLGDLRFSKRPAGRFMINCSGDRMPTYVYDMCVGVCECVCKCVRARACARFLKCMCMCVFVRFLKSASCTAA